MNLRGLKREWMLFMSALVLATACRGASPSDIQYKRAWFVDSDLSNIAIVAVDFQTLELEAAYFSRQKPCGRNHPPVSDEELKSRAGGLFGAIEDDWLRRIVEGPSGQREELAFDVSRVGDFVLLEMPAGDSGGFAVFHPCSGFLLYAGSIVWGGTGRSLYPAVSVPSGALRRASRRAPPPERIDVVIGSGAHADEDGGMAAWNSVRDLNLVRELASAPYTVLVYLYPRTVGMSNPDSADWIVFVHRRPIRETWQLPTVTTWVSPLPTLRPFLSPIIPQP